MTVASTAYLLDSQRAKQEAWPGKSIGPTGAVATICTFAFVVRQLIAKTVGPAPPAGRLDSCFQSCKRLAGSAYGGQKAQCLKIASTMSTGVRASEPFEN